MWDICPIFETVRTSNGSSRTICSSSDQCENSFIKTCNRRFEESIHRILLLEKLFEHVNITNILEWAETGQEEKEVLTVAKRLKINSIMLQHAMYSGLWG